MFFESLNIHGFGRLRTSVNFVPDKLNLVIAENEAGKSTLVSAILAAFYGIEEDFRITSSRRPHLRNFLPWTDPETFGLTLDFVTDNVRYRIERNFHDRTVKLIDVQSAKDHSLEYHRGRNVYRIGEELIGLSCSDFLKSFYLKQEETIEIRDTRDLTSHVQRTATALEGGATSEEAIERLRLSLKKYPLSNHRNPITVETFLKRLNKDKDETSQTIDSLNRDRDGIEPICTQLSALERKLTSLEEIREANSRLGDKAEIKEHLRRLEMQESLKKEYQQLTTKADALKEFEHFPADRIEQLDKLSGRIEESTDKIERIRGDIESKVVSPLKDIERELRSFKSLLKISGQDLQEFESALSRFEDRRSRYTELLDERDHIGEKLRSEGFDQEHFAWQQQVFDKLSDEELLFIDEFRVTYAEEEAGYREAQARREGLERQQVQIAEERSKRISTSRVLFIIAAIIVIIGGMMMMASSGWIAQIVVGMGVLTGASGAVVRSMAGSRKSTGLEGIETEFKKAIETEVEARRKLDGVSSDLDEIRVAAGITDSSELLSEYSLFEKMKDFAEPLNEADRAVERARNETADAVNRISPFFEKVDEKPPEESLVDDATRDLLERYRTVLKLKEEKQALATRREQMDEDLERLQKGHDSYRELAGEILEMGNITDTGSLDTAVEAFREAAGKHHELRSIMDDRLPRLERDLLPDDEIDPVMDRLAYLRDKIPAGGMEGDLEHSSDYYREQAEQASRRMNELNDERMELTRRISSVLDQYQSQHPGMRRHLSELDENIRQAETFQAEVETAISIMEEISGEVYRVWATALSEEAAPFLEALNPGYKDLKFDDNLSFTVVDRRLGKTILSKELEQTISVGAGDEIFLSARLGIASYLSRGAKEPLPVILDEPLATADDEKFLRGMKFFLGTLSRSHQVLILSCHGQRHRWLAEQIPELFRDRVHEFELISD